MKKIYLKKIKSKFSMWFHENYTHCEICGKITNNKNIGGHNGYMYVCKKCRKK